MRNSDSIDCDFLAGIMPDLMAIMFGAKSTVVSGTVEVSLVKPAKPKPHFALDGDEMQARMLKGIIREAIESEDYERAAFARDELNDILSRWKNRNAERKI